MSDNYASKVKALTDSAAEMLEVNGPTMESSLDFDTDSQLERDTWETFKAALSLVVEATERS